MSNCKPNECLWPNCDCDSPPVEKRGVNYVQEVLGRKAASATKDLLKSKLQIMFTISTAAFNFQRTILQAFGNPAPEPSTMERLHIMALGELNRVEPNMEYIHKLLQLMEEEAVKNKAKNGG